MSSAKTAHEAMLRYHDDGRKGYEDRSRELSVQRNRDGSWLWKVDVPGIAIRRPLKSGMCQGEDAMAALENALTMADQQSEVWEFYR